MTTRRGLYWNMCGIEWLYYTWDLRSKIKVVKTPLRTVTHPDGTYDGSSTSQA